MTVIETRDLRKEFTVRVKSGWLRRRTRMVAAVDGIALTVQRGEMVGYIGPNGAGKSTTLKMLTGVLYPSAGQVRVCGLEPVPQRTRLARRIGVVFGQRTQLWWDLPLRDSFAVLRLHLWTVDVTHRGRQVAVIRDGLGSAQIARSDEEALSRGGQFLNPVEQATARYCDCPRITREDTAVVLNKELILLMRKNCCLEFVLIVGG